jgi:Lon protease-like protein
VSWAREAGSHLSLAPGSSAGAPRAPPLESSGGEQAAGLLIPLFPLHTVLFPGGLLPLHVFEERYRLLVRERRDFGVVLIRRGREVGPGEGEDVMAVGTVARLDEVHALPDGRFYVLGRGLDRFRIQSLDRSRPYLSAWVEMLDPPPEAPRPRLLQLLERYLRLRGLELTDELVRELRGSGRSLVWTAGSLLEVEPPKRQQLLETGDAALAESLLAAEAAKLETIGELGGVPPRRSEPN